MCYLERHIPEFSFPVHWNLYMAINILFSYPKQWPLGLYSLLFIYFFRAISWVKEGLCPVHQNSNLMRGAAGASMALNFTSSFVKQRTSFLQDYLPPSLALLSTGTMVSKISFPVHFFFLEVSISHYEQVAVLQCTVIFFSSLINLSFSIYSCCCDHPPLLSLGV